MSAEINLLISAGWKDYELKDSGGGEKLERFGDYLFVRPEAQAIWKKRLSESEWVKAHAKFLPSGEESGGHWQVRKEVPERWMLKYGGLKCWVMTTPGRHLGVFPEGAAHWDWMQGLVGEAGKEVQVLNLFGYTGLASLAAAKAGARVTHVDASKKAIGWARQNQELSGLEEKPIRWIVDDALKFVQREARRGARYHGLIIDPPKFGRGPKGEVWEVFKSLPMLMETCHEVLDEKPLFCVLTVYAVRCSALHLGAMLDELMEKFGGAVEAGELVTRETSGGRLLSQAVYARWANQKGG